MPRTLRRARSGAVVIGAIVLGACGAGSGEDRACGPTTRESLDPAYLVHVLGDMGDLEYTSDPPTSGPHQPGPAVAGVAAEPLSRPVQVGILERGDILLQHLPDLPDAARADLEALAGDRVVVAPNPDLPAPVVATAWLFKRTCESADPVALQDFVDEHAGNGPEG